MIQDFGWIHLVPLLKGAWLTIVLCFFSGIFGTLIGIIAGIGATLQNRILQKISAFYINLLRGIPLLLIIFMVFYGLPMLEIGFKLPREFAAVFSLSIYTGAYMGEIVRGGIQSVDQGQFQAAKALGMNNFKMYSNVIFPQAVKYIIPPGIGFIIALVKDSSLVSVIGYIDLTRAGKNISNLTFDPFTTYLVVALIYFIISYVLSKVSFYYESKYFHNGRSTT